MEQWAKQLLQHVKIITSHQQSLASNLKLRYFRQAMTLYEENYDLSPANQSLNESLTAESTGHLSGLHFLTHYNCLHGITL
jgi:hypothetical protein